MVVPAVERRKRKEGDFMYINPFLAGILATIGTELCLVVLYATYTVWRDKRK